MMTDEQINKKLAAENLQEDIALAKFECANVEEIGREDLWPAFLRYTAIFAIFCIFAAILMFGGR